MDSMILIVLYYNTHRRMVRAGIFDHGKWLGTQSSKE